MVYVGWKTTIIVNIYIYKIWYHVLSFSAAFHMQLKFSSYNQKQKLRLFLKLKQNRN